MLCGARGRRLIISKVGRARKDRNNPEIGIVCVISPKSIWLSHDTGYARKVAYGLSVVHCVYTLDCLTAELLYDSC